jgi:HSP20 family molecular chaperone IbpA
LAAARARGRAAPLEVTSITPRLADANDERREKMIARKINTAFPVVRCRPGLDDLFGDFFEAFSPTVMLRPSARGVFPAVNVREDEQTLYAEAELPGLKMDDIEVYVMGDELTIKGEYKDESSEDVTYHRRERGTGSFNRVLRLPVEVDEAEAAVPRKIEVKS